MRLIRPHGPWTLDMAEKRHFNVQAVSQVFEFLSLCQEMQTTVQDCCWCVKMFFNLSSGIPPSILQLMTLSYSMYRYENQGKFSCMQNVKLVFFAALLPSHSTFPTMNSPQLLLSTICMSLFCSSNFVFNFRHHYPHKAPTLKLTPTACRWSRCNCGLCVQARWTKPLHGYH